MTVCAYRSFSKEVASTRNVDTKLIRALQNINGKHETLKKSPVKKVVTKSTTVSRTMLNDDSSSDSD